MPRDFPKHPDTVKRFQNLADIHIIENESFPRLKVLLLADDKHIANVVIDHIQAFVSSSHHDIKVLNTIHEPCPKEISTTEFDAILIHYSIYTLGVYFLPMDWAQAIALFSGPKAQIIQDECRFINSMKHKMEFLGINAVFSSLDLENIEKVYEGDILSNTFFYSCLPGYISHNLFLLNPLPIEQREYHIVYRGRELSAELGKHAQDKQTIGKQVKEASLSYGLNIDIEWDENSRIYGGQWITFLASGRATLGVEGGASIFDFDGSLARQVYDYQKKHPHVGFEQIWNTLLKGIEGNVVHKTITPKIFEAIAAKTALILYPGRYRDILRANEHYIPLERDGSNLKEVFALLNDYEYIQALVNRTHQEIMERHNLTMEFYVHKVDCAIANNWLSNARKSHALMDREKGYAVQTVGVLNVLVLYNSTQTYTVKEHLNNFSKYSRFNFYYAHHKGDSTLNVYLDQFDVVVIHYSIRLPFDQISNPAASILENYNGLKVLFIQDEYNNTQRGLYWIKRIGFQLVFTVVPEHNISKVYPQNEFPETKFINNLAGYVPENITYRDCSSPSSRNLIVGYRARSLPVEHGQLGFEKVNVGRLVKQYCRTKKIGYDISWNEEDRIYGKKWYEFMASCRSMLGSENGCNVFDWDGTLAARIQKYRKKNPQAKDNEIYKAIIQHLEISGLMNQVTPHIFEAIASRTVLVLFEGCYSGIVIPNIHYIPLKKDGSNLGEVFRLLEDNEFVNTMTDRAYQDIIMTGKYSFKTFVQMVDEEIEAMIKNMSLTKTAKSLNFRDVILKSTSITRSPICADPTEHSTLEGLFFFSGLKKLFWSCTTFLWSKLSSSKEI